MIDLLPTERDCRHPCGGSAATTIFNFNNNEQQTATGLLDTMYQYGYDPLGLTDAITTTVQGVPSVQTLTHDAAGRLTAASGGSSSGGSSSGAWSYDGRGNLTSATFDSATSTYSYSASNPEEVASVATSGQPTTFYGYDADGDTTSITSTGTLNRQLTYDDYQRLTQATLGSPVTETVTLGYNAFGQRASYTVTPAGKAASLVESFKYQGDQPRRGRRGRGASA